MEIKLLAYIFELMLYIDFLSLKLYLVNAIAQILQERINQMWNHHYNTPLIKTLIYDHKL